MDLELRPIVDDEFEDFRTAVSRGFGHDPHSQPEYLEGSRALTENGRTAVVVDDGRFVGTILSYPFEMTVPGGTIATSGLSAVTVAATHRRQGVLTKMMRAHFDDATARGEPISYLWASETGIYGRFGYGSAMDLLLVEVDLPRAGLRERTDLDRVRLIEAEQAPEVLPPVYERNRHQRPGALVRSSTWWKYRHLLDVENDRNGYTGLRYLVAERDGGVVGYALYRQKADWDEAGPKGEIDVRDLMADDDRAAATLWSHLASIDLFTSLKVDPPLPLDTELPTLMENSRAVSRKVGDGTWVRVLDPAAALGARRYRTPGETTFALRDPFLPVNDGTWRLTVGSDGSATCSRIGDAPAGDAPAGDAPAAAAPTGQAAEGVPTLDVAALGAMYLGARSPWALRAAGLVAGDDTALQRLDAAFAWSPLPWCPDGF